ncbi:RsmB/NOP family class I SAM-dependent RNA methyltransferase [Rhodovulum sp. DZ06]|uniref:RsmB/NOP family class I SAM-dependent RNA methyltransferase n=1 Tax=Rhodovulum sp. DZ06 TaxID=3425126 RepID=UPI003D351529
MTPAARLSAVIDLLHAVEQDPRPADAVTSAFLRSRRYIEERDRGAVLGMLGALLRCTARLGWNLERLDAPDDARLRVLAWLLLGEGRTPEQAARLFSGDRFAPPALTGRERRLAEELVEGGALEHPDMPDWVRLECPPWALGPLKRRFGDAFAAEMEATLAPPPVDLRVNPLRSTREAVVLELQALGLDAGPTPLAPLGVRVRESFSLARLEGLKTGEIEIQDEGSQLVAALVDARPGERAVDFCAGAGGKTLALAAGMEGKGHVVACDVNAARLKRCAERLRKAGLHNVETKLLSGESDKWVKRRKGTFDRVLVDAPCSGTGTWRRNPDARWRDEGEGLAALAALQARILASAARLVKPGGRLVYATCSLLAEENEDQVAAFLAGAPDFRQVPVAEAAPELAAAAPGAFEGDALSLTPARHDTDGFFAAVMVRAEAPEVPEAPAGTPAGG